MAISSAASTIAALAAAFKELFPDKRLEQLAVTDRDLFKWLPKKDDLEGDGIWVPIRHGLPQGLGSGYTQAQGNVTAGKASKFFIERNGYHGFVSLDWEAIRAARSRKGSFYGIKETEIEDMITNMTMELETALWRDGSGAKGVIASITNANPAVITLTNPEDVLNFQLNETLECRTGATDRGGDEKIAVINPDAGTITMTSNVVADHSWQAADSLYRGDGAAAASDYNSQVKGLAAWIPAVAETSGTFLQMARASDPLRLQGFRQAFLAGIEETLKKQTAKMNRWGSMPDCVWLSHDNWHRLELELGSRCIRKDGVATTFGLPTISFSSPKRQMSIYAGAHCPEDTGYLLKRDSFMLHHLDGLPHLDVSDGNSVLRSHDFDGIVVHGRSWSELACDAPFHNGRFTIS